MYNSTECSKNYSKTTGIFWNYYRDEPNSSVVENIINLIRGSKSLDNKASVTATAEGNNAKNELKFVAPFKNLSNFWRTLDITLIICEIT